MYADLCDCLLSAIGRRQQLLVVVAVAVFLFAFFQKGRDGIRMVGVLLKNGIV